MIPPRLEGPQRHLRVHESLHHHPMKEKVLQLFDLLQTEVLEPNRWSWNGRLYQEIESRPVFHSLLMQLLLNLEIFKGAECTLVLTNQETRAMSPVSKLINNITRFLNKVISEYIIYVSIILIIHGIVGNLQGVSS